MSTLATFTDRWASAKHVGVAAPWQQVLVRLGHFEHRYEPWTTSDVRADIYGESRHKPWMSVWTPRSEWRELPGVSSVKLEQTYDGKGVEVATVVLQNTALVPKTGPMGDLYHLIELGYLSPYRGSPYDLPLRPVVANEWYGYLTKNAQIRVRQGYGPDAVLATFTGLIDDVDTDSHPAQITLTSRNFGKTLTDQEVFGWSKSPQIDEPTIFRSLPLGGGKAVGHAPDASSTRDGYPPRFAIDTVLSSRWISQDHSAPGVTEWLEVRLPRGHYESFVIHNAYPDMEMFVGVYARQAGRGKRCTIDGDPIDDGWIYPSEAVGGGDGIVPGENGGWPYLRRWGRVSNKGNVHLLKHDIELGDDSVLRVAFRNLAETDPGVYRAGVVRLQAVQYPSDYKKGKRTTAPKVIVVQDVSDMVKVVLRWAGFKEWVVEDTGAALDAKWTFNRANKLMDVIDKACELTGYVFFIAPPPDDDPESLGIPYFVHNSSQDVPTDLRVVKDTNLLTALQAKHTDDVLASIIRVRGAADKSKGVRLGADREKRLQAIYRPPWATNRRLAGLIKHQITADNLEKVLPTEQACMVYAQLIALQMALQADTATLSVPGYPVPLLNDQVALVDTATGLNTRLWLASRSSEFTIAENGATTWMTTLGGSLLDTTDFQLVLRDLRETLGDDGTAGAVVNAAAAMLGEFESLAA